MKKCIYAFDTDDEYCKNCDGVNIKQPNGDSTPATNCAGYEAGTEEVVTGKEDFMTPPETQEDEVPFIEENVTANIKIENEKIVTKKEVKNDLDTKEVNTPSTDLEPENDTDIANNTVDKEVEFINSTPKSIRIMSGCTVEVHGVYYKFKYEQENELCDGITPEQLEEEKEKLWAMANMEVDKQLEQVK